MRGCLVRIACAILLLSAGSRAFGQAGYSYWYPPRQACPFQGTPQMTYPTLTPRWYPTQVAQPISSMPRIGTLAKFAEPTVPSMPLAQEDPLPAPDVKPAPIAIAPESSVPVKKMEIANKVQPKAIIDVGELDSGFRVSAGPMPDQYIELNPAFETTKGISTNKTASSTINFEIPDDGDGPINPLDSLPSLSISSSGAVNKRLPRGDLFGIHELDLLSIGELEMDMEHGCELKRNSLFVRAGTISQVYFGLGNGSSPDGNLSLFGLQFSAGFGF
jgi:hypothetical protein